MRRRPVPKDLTPVVVGLLIVVVGSMMWKMQESFASAHARPSGAKNKTNTSCKSNSECKDNKKCVKGTCS